MRLNDTIPIVSSACVCSLLWACGGDVGDFEEIGTSRAALSSYQYVFASDVTECEDDSQDRALDTAALFENDTRPILFSEGNNCNGTYTEYVDWFDKAWGPGGHILKSRLRAVPGNHDYLTANAQGFKQYFNYSTTWHKFTFGTSWHIFALDSNQANNATQLTWLDTELAKIPAGACILAYFHHPRYSSGNKHPPDRAIADTLWQRLSNKHADLVLSGHEHNFEHLIVDGMSQFVVGTAGAEWNGFDAIDAHSVKRLSNVYGVLGLTLYDSAPVRYSVSFKAVGGTVKYSYGANCRTN